MPVPEVEPCTFLPIDRKIISTLTNNPIPRLFNGYGYPNPEAVAEVASRTDLGEAAVYYRLKFLRSLEIFTPMPNKIDVDRLRAFESGAESLERGGIYDIREVIVASADGGRKPIPIDLYKLPILKRQLEEDDIIVEDGEVEYPFIPFEEAARRAEEQRRTDRKRLNKILTLTSERALVCPPQVAAREAIKLLEHGFPKPIRHGAQKLFGMGIQLLDYPQNYNPSEVISTVRDVLQEHWPGRKLEKHFPDPLSAAAMYGLVGEYVHLALPYTEADEQSLAMQFVTAVGNIIGRGCYCSFGTDRHYPNLFCNVVGATSSGKGQALSCARNLLAVAFPDWESRSAKYSAASGEAVVRLASEAEQAGGKLLLIMPEMSVLLNGMNREGCTTSGYLRLGYDGMPLENQRARGSIIARNYIMSVLGHITPAETSSIVGYLDWYNGVGNRFLWIAGRKSKTLARMTKSPSWGTLPDKLKQLVALPSQVGCGVQPRRWRNVG